MRQDLSLDQLISGPDQAGANTKATGFVWWLLVLMLELQEESESGPGHL